MDRPYHLERVDRDCSALIQPQLNRSTASLTYLIHLKYTMDAIKQVYDKVKSEYGKNITNKLKMVDALAVYALVTAVVQVKNA